MKQIYPAFIFIFLLSSVNDSLAQQYIFAQLNGSPNMDYTGWNLAGAANIGDTGRDADNFSNEMILCPPNYSTSGACFYATALDLNICTQWTAEFDYRIWDGNGADGIAFCFLQNPPTGYVVGGGLGIPSNANGLMVCLDPYNNCGGANPELQIRYPNYNECPSPAQPTLYNQSILRQSAYHHMKVIYNAGSISVYIDNVFYLGGNYTANYVGYLGFTASTGALTDRHSIRNAIIYTDMPPSDAGADLTMCSGDTIQIGTTSNPNFNYSWSPSTGLDNPNISDPNLTLTNFSGSPVQYSYVVETDSAGASCLSTDTIVVTVNPAQLISLPPQTICIGDSAQLNATGFSTYAWNASPTLSCINCQSPFAFPTSTTTYTVTGTLSGGCNAMGTQTVNVNPLPAVNAGNDVSICYGDTTYISQNGVVFGTYIWAPNADITCSNCPGTNAYPLTSTTYTLTIGDLNGCIDSDDVDVNVYPQFVINAGIDQSICTGDSVSLNASAAASYSWSPSTGLSCANCQSPFAFPNSTTTYTLTATDANGCTETDDIIISVNQLPTGTISPGTTICNGDSVQLNVSGGASYSWLPTSTLSCNTCNNPFAFPTSTTTYTVSIISAAGCSVIDSVTLSVNTSLVVNAGADVSICSGNSVQLNASGGGNYSWSPSTGLSSTTINNPVANPIITTTYDLVVTDANGCSGTDDVTVTVNPNPIANAGLDLVVCDGTSNLIGGNPTATSGTSPYNYSWLPVTGLDNPALSNPTATISSAQNYSVIVTDANGCTAIDAMNVTVTPMPVATAGNDQTICIGDMVPLQSGGGTTYQWIPATGLDNPNTQNPNASPIVTTNYSVSVGDANGCGFDTATVLITVNQLPIVLGDTIFNITEADEAQINLSGGIVWSWTPSADLSCSDCANPIASPNETTQYLVTVTDLNGCVNTINILIIVEEVCNSINIPNAFTPNGDGLNDVFNFINNNIFNQVIEFKIYDRWGNVVFDDKSGTGWDGKNKFGLLYEVGSFTYFLRIQCAEGEEIVKGNLTLIH